MTRCQQIKTKTLKIAFIFNAGGLVYAGVELLFRGRTHWSMLVAGGICAVLLYLIAVKSREPLWEKWIMGGVVITTVEFLAGIIVNIILGWHVWSYAHSWANLFGQICLLYTLLWMLISIPGIWLLQFVERSIFKENKGGS